MKLSAGNPGRRTALLASGLMIAGFVVAGCGGSSPQAQVTQGTTPAAALAAAKKSFDASTSVHFTMSTGSTPTSGDAVLGADGTLTNQPAFDGNVKALYKGFTVTIPVRSVGGKVYAKLPLATSYSVIDPAQFSAPDPADFINPAKGISGLLIQLKDAKAGGQQRQGSTIVNTYSGTLGGALVAPIIPSASASGTYKTVVGIAEDGRIATLAVTGGFFAANGDVTFTLVFDTYNKSVTVTAP